MALAKAKPEAMLHQDLLARDIIGTINRCAVSSHTDQVKRMLQTWTLPNALAPQPAGCGIHHETQPGRCSRRDELAARRSNKKGARLIAPLLDKQLLGQSMCLRNATILDIHACFKFSFAARSHVSHRMSIGDWSTRHVSHRSHDSATHLMPGLTGHDPTNIKLLTAVSHPWFLNPAGLDRHAMSACQDLTSPTLLELRKLMRMRKKVTAVHDTLYLYI